MWYLHYFFKVQENKKICEHEVSHDAHGTSRALFRSVVPPLPLAPDALLLSPSLAPTKRAAGGAAFWRGESARPRAKEVPRLVLASSGGRKLSTMYSCHSFYIY